MLRLYNTLTKQVEEFKPRDPMKVQMFVCGPTVYNHIHIGNARTFTVFDALAKYLRHREFKLFYLQNITDIDDKIIKRAQEENSTVKEITRKYDHDYRNDLQLLKITSVDKYARATDYIEAIIKQVQTLIDKGHAYEIDDGIYFDLSTFPEYGKLSGRTEVHEDDGISRIDENPQKRNIGDFCLWKRSKDSEPSWSAPWFAGRPGWHIEDTAITETEFGPQYDLHGGGMDLVFPHHEAEITQQESASELKPFVRHWVHVGFLVNSSQKMSKSRGNFALANELLRIYDGEVVRFYLLSGHYRASLDWNDTAMPQAEAAITRIGEFMNRMQFYENKNPLSHESDVEVAAYLQNKYAEIITALDDDFNTPKALGLLFEVIRTCNQYITDNKIDMHSAKRILHILDIFDHVFGIVPLGTTSLPEDIQKLVDIRQTAKEKKDFTTADEIRTQLQELGYSIDDTLYGPLVKKQK